MPELVQVIASTEASKAPFFIAGTGLVIWAVVLSAVGLARAGFPSSRTGARVVMAVSGFFMVATMFTAVSTASKPGEEEPGERETHGAEAKAEPRPEGQAGGTSGGGESSPPAGGGEADSSLEVTADATDLTYEQKSLTAAPGRVTIRFRNPSSLEHDVRVERDGRVLGGTEVISDDDTTASVQLEPGRYTFFCSVDAHREAGMEGPLTVEAAEAPAGGPGKDSPAGEGSGAPSPRPDPERVPGPPR